MQSITAALDERRRQGLYRSRRVLQCAQGVWVRYEDRDYLNFGSNNYLGLANHPALIQSSSTSLQQNGVGSGAAHLLCGHFQVHHELEQALAQFTGRAQALLFSTGYMANLALMTTFSGKGDAVFADRLAHASLLDGIRLSQAKLRRFDHNDCKHLETLLAAWREKNPRRRALVVTEGVFSMDGDCAPLDRIAAIAQRYRAMLVVDDAHGIGVIGEQGRGCVHHHGVNNQTPLLMGTFGKALGGFGAFVAGDPPLMDYIVQFARPYMYTTAPPPAMATAALTALQLLQQEPWRLENLRRRIAQFRSGAQNLGLRLIESDSAIQPVILGDTDVATRWGETLWKQGIYTGVVRPPTVAMGQSRLRISLNADHQPEQVDILLHALAGLQHG